MSSTTSIPQARVDSFPGTEQQRSDMVVVALFVAITAALALAGAGGVLRLAYPVLAVLTALFLFYRSKPSYVSFTIWMWFLSPLVRRLADLRAGFQETSLILLAPYLVTAISALLFVTSPRGLTQRRNLPVVLGLAATAYGFGVGLLKYSVVQMTPALINWIVPLCLAYLIVECRHEYEKLVQSIQTAFLYGALIMGIYAVYQFFSPPPWDRLWLQNMRTLTFGLPEPMEIRDFSTMNAPVVFALTMTAILLVALGSTRKLRFVSGPIGLVGLILTLNRSAWLGLVAGITYIVARLPNRDRVRVVIALFLFATLAIIGTSIPSVDEVVSKRFNTFSSPGQDSSYLARIEGYGKAFKTLAAEPFGEGVGSPDIDHPTLEDDDAIGPHDSTLLELLYSFGWFGTACYLCGLGIVFAYILPKKLSGRFEIGATAVLIAFGAQSLLNIVLSGPIGIFFWVPSSLVLAYVEVGNEERASAGYRARAGLAA